MNSKSCHLTCSLPSLFILGTTNTAGLLRFFCCIPHIALPAAAHIPYIEPMDQNGLSRSFDPPSPPRERETSPKRKRTDDTGEVNVVLRGNVDAGTRRLSPNRPDTPAMWNTTNHIEDHDKRTTDEEVDDFLRRCDDRFARARLPQEKSEKTLHRRLLNSITATQVTQARVGNDLRVLTNKLHDWARHLTAQERYLHQLQAELIEQQHEMTRKLLDAAVKQMESNFHLAESSSEHNEAEQVEQLKLTVGVLETNIENLISELMIEKEARAVVEEKLQVRENTGETKADSPTEETLGSDEVDEYMLLTRSKSPSPVSSQ